MRKRIVACIAQSFNREVSEVEERLEQMEEWDSLSHLNMVLDIEALFDVAFTLEDIVTISTVSDIVRLVGEQSDGNPV